MTDFIAHSNGVIVDCNEWDAWDVENHRQGVSLYMYDIPLDPEHKADLDRFKLEHEACTQIGRTMLRMEDIEDPREALESMCLDANIYFE